MDRPGTSKKSGNEGPGDPEQELEVLCRDLRQLTETQRLGLEGLRRELKDAGYWGTVALVAVVALLVALNGLLWRQVAQHLTHLEKNRRIELLTLVFDTEDCDLFVQRRNLERDVAAAEERLAAAEPESQEALRARYELRVVQSRDVEHCPPQAPLRLREEAVLALAKIDGRRLALRRADLRRAVLQDVQLFGVDLSGADLSGANLSHADLQSTFLRRARAVGTYLRGAYLQKADMKRIDLTAAYLSEANLTDADLAGARLVEANLIRTIFARTNLKNADFRDADVGGADLSRARHLTQAQLDSAWGTFRTRIPEDLDRPGHWRKADPDDGETTPEDPPGKP